MIKVTPVGRVLALGVLALLSWLGVSRVHAFSDWVQLGRHFGQSRPLFGFVRKPIPYVYRDQMRPLKIEWPEIIGHFAAEVCKKKMAAEL